MINPYMLGFVGVAALTGLGVDYYNQSLLAGKDLGRISAQAYAQSITARLNDTRADLAQARAKLPAPASGTPATATTAMSAESAALSAAIAAANAPKPGETGQPEAAPAEAAQAPAKPQSGQKAASKTGFANETGVRRLKLSGGTTCLNGSGRLCD